MIISTEQVRLAAEYLQTSGEYSETLSETHAAAGAKIVELVMESLQCVPDVRSDRIEHARALIRDGLPPASDLAEKLIGRVISDSIR